jgi:hypothetical protein
MPKLWTKCNLQIQAVIEATVGRHGDLQGIAGRAIPEIEGCLCRSMRTTWSGPKLSSGQVSSHNLDFEPDTR